MCGGEKMIKKIIKLFLIKHKINIKRFFILIIKMVLIISSINSVAKAGEMECGALTTHFGPWDFYDPANHKRTGAAFQGRVKIVTGKHLTKNMLRLKRGSTALDIMQDLDYTLRAIPNHPQALDLASRFSYQRSISESFKKRQKKLTLTAECYFDRAFRLTPTRAEVWMIYGIHNHRFKNYKKAISNYLKANKLGLDSPEINYYLGLSYFADADYDNARKQATKAYDGGYPLEGLKNKLVRINQWKVN